MQKKQGYAAILEKDQDRDEILEMDKALTERLYFYKYKALKNFMKKSSLGISVISGITGLAFYADLSGALVSPVASLFGSYATQVAFVGALIVGALAAAVLEYLRHFLSDIAFRDIYTAKRFASYSVSIAMLVCFAILVGFSFYSSVDGVSTLTEGQAVAPATVSLDSIKKAYAAEEKTLLAKQKDIEARNTYLGKTFLTKEDRKANLAVENQIADVKKRMGAAIDAANTANAKLTTKAEGKTSAKTAKVAGFIAVLEILAMVFLWFPYHYSFQSVQQAETILNSVAVTSLTHNQLNELITIVRLGDQALAPASMQPGAVQIQPPKPAPIGFTRARYQDSNDGAGLKGSGVQGSSSQAGVNGGVNGDLNNATALELENYLKMHPKVVEAIQAGFTNGEIVEYSRVSLSTVHNVKRCYRAYQAALNSKVV